MVEDRNQLGYRLQRAFSNGPASTLTIFHQIVFLAGLFSLLVLVGGCSVPYTRGDKIALGVFVASSFADYRTTTMALDTGRLKEANPFMGEYPPDETVLAFKAANLGIVWLLGEIWPEHRLSFIQRSGKVVSLP